ncbi:MAG: hypothetical protein QGG40_02735 [Myxococcota bacterium]|jgi:hypothetical protein|nr:hypothetical protein [Myxococcota bacterium]
MVNLFRAWSPVLCLGLLTGCIRPSDTYEVDLYGAGTELDAVLPAPEPMGGVIEYTRMRLWGTNLGHGLSGLYGDAPRADGTGFTIANAYFGYPRDPGFDRNSSFLTRGPDADSGEDACVTRTVTTGYFGFSEYVDVGDHIALTAEDGARIVLERDPSVHPRPAGASWYSSYGGTLRPDIQDHDHLDPTWRSDETWNFSFPGTVMPPESTMGAIPYPLTDAQLQAPPSIDDLAVGGETVRAPHHYYDDKGEWVGYDVFDDVRYAGPWTEAMDVTWTPSEEGTPLTLSIRYLGVGEEYACSCSADCDDGFSCIDGSCYGDDGAGWVVLGELTCTVADDGKFTFRPSHLETLDGWVSPGDIAGAVLAAARITEGTAEVEDALTFNGKRVPLSPVRTRLTDLLYTRLEAP